MKGRAAKRAARDKEILAAFFSARHDSIKELARELDMSESTVSRAIDRYFARVAKKRARERSADN